jgi:hypothetical protein
VKELTSEHAAPEWKTVTFLRSADPRLVQRHIDVLRAEGWLRVQVHSTRRPQPKSSIDRYIDEKYMKMTFMRKHK